MDKIESLPDWFDEIGENPNFNDPHIIPILTSIYRHGDAYYFDGPVAALLARNKTPRFIEIAGDMIEAYGMIHLRYSAKKVQHKINDLYIPIDLESVALVWNEEPDAISGFGADDIRLFVRPAPDDTGYPFLSTFGTLHRLKFRDHRFKVHIDPGFGHEVEQFLEAAR